LKTTVVPKRPRAVEVDAGVAGGVAGDHAGVVGAVGGGGVFAEAVGDRSSIDDSAGRAEFDEVGGLVVGRLAAQLSGEDDVSVGGDGEAAEHVE